MNEKERYLTKPDYLILTMDDESIKITVNANVKPKSVCIKDIDRQRRYYDGFEADCRSTEVSLDEAKDIDWNTLFADPYAFIYKMM